MNSGEGYSDQIYWGCLLPTANPAKSQKPHGIGHWLSLLPKRLLDSLTISGDIQDLLVFAKLCLTLCNPMDSSPPYSSVHGISQARILEHIAISFSRNTGEWIAISFSKGSSWPRDQTRISCFGRLDSLPLSYQGSPRTGYPRQMLKLAYMLMNESCLECFFRKGPHSIWWEGTYGLKLFCP